MRPRLARLIARFQRLTPRQRSLWLAVGCAALIVLVVAGSLLALGLQSGSAPQTADTPAATATSVATDTAAASPHATNTSAPRRPAPIQGAVSKPLPPPPPPPPAPPPTSNFCPTPTPYPLPTATATPTEVPTPSATATATFSTTPSASAPAIAALAASCVPCPNYTGNNPSQTQLAAALDSAAARYSLPRNLVRAVAWQESRWHEDVTSCDGGVGLMQIQWYYVDYFNNLHYAACGLPVTSYDVNDAQGNANLGAKVLAYLKCYYDFGGPYGGTAGAPANGSSAFYYQQVGLPYPDSARSPSFCAAVYQDAASPAYPSLPENVASDAWSCPYTPTTGDSTLLDITLSAYNAGPGAIYNCGCIPNPGYVAAVEGFVPQFAAGALP